MHKSSNWEWSSWPLVRVESCRLGSFSTMSMGKIFRSIHVGRCGEFGRFSESRCREVLLYLHIIIEVFFIFASLYLSRK